MVNFAFDARRLARLLFPSKTLDRAESYKDRSDGKASNPVIEDEALPVDEMSIKLADALFDAIKHRVTTAPEDSPVAMLALTEPAHVREPERPPGVDALMKQPMPESFYRFRARNSDWCLSVRASKFSLEIFVVPTKDVPFLSFGEYDTRLKARLELVNTRQGFLWCLNKHRVRTEEILNLLDKCIDLLFPARGEEGGHDFKSAGKSFQRFNQRTGQDGLALQVQNLAYRLVSQQDELKKEISRELHDGIIADLLMLKRHMCGDRPLTHDEAIETIDEIVDKLRDLCNDFAPRNFKDWGLKVNLEGLIERMEERSGIRCHLACASDLPTLPDLVQLHVFRIVQEALMNVEKYSQAADVHVTIEHDAVSGRFNVSVKDNGSGFVVDEMKESKAEGGGMGMTGMQQRAEIIRTLYPATFVVDSMKGTGTEVRLELQLK